jgi:formate--tetrahydrofolate ligase
MPLRQKLETIAHEIYGAGGVTVGARLQARFTELEEAGFVVAICGDIMTMPGLPREPAAERIHIDTHGRVEGLF